MSRLFYHTMQDNAGNLLFGVSGTMRLAGSGTLATIYGDEALTVILPNPMTNHSSFGSFKCFLGAGDYDFYMAKAGYTFETLTGVQGHGTMAQQDASAVAITGGSAQLGQVGLGTPAQPAYALTVGTGLQSFMNGPLGLGDAPNPAYILNAVGGVRIAGPTEIAGPLTGITTFGVGTVPDGNVKAQIHYNKNTDIGLKIRQTGIDTGSYSILFGSVADTIIGSITTTASATAYNTASDSRLKHDVDDLTGELALVQALRPVRFKWNVDDSDGMGFLAHEVGAVLAGVITGEQDAVNEDGSIRPMMIDYSKLVPVLTGAVKSLIERVEALQARVEVLEDAAGV